MSTEINPYASPAAIDEETPRQYRSSLLFTAFFIFAWIVLLILLGDWLNGDLPESLAVFAETVPRLALYVAVFSAAVVWLFPVYVSSRGIRSYTIWGNYDDIAWECIDRVRSINLLGMRYVRLYSTSIRRPIWIPLYLSRMKEFVAEVNAHTSIEHPLNKYFASYSTNRTSSK
jgi:hypothetical protein